MASEEKSARPECREIIERLDGDQETQIWDINVANPRDAVGDRELPKKGDPHALRSDLFCTERRIRRVAAGYCEATLVYSTVGRPYGDDYQDELEVDIGAEEKTIYIDLDGKTIFMDAEGNVQGASVYMPRSMRSYTIWRSFLDENTIEFCIAKVNSEPWHGKKPGTMLYLGANARRVGHEKWQIRHHFLYNPDGHLVRKPQIYTRTFVEADIAFIKQGIATTEDDLQLYDEYRVYEEVDFKLLGV